MIRDYTKNLASLRDQARRIATGVRGDAERIDASDLFPPEWLGALWEAGFMTMAVPKSWGGLGLSVAEAAMVVEELARGSGAAALKCLLQFFALRVIAEAGDEQRTREWFEKIVAERALVAVAISEPEPSLAKSGDVTTIRRAGQVLTINGVKSFVTGAREADLVVVFGAGNPKAGLKTALNAVLVPAGTLGMRPGGEFSRTGLRGCSVGDLVFDRVKVPAAARLGKAGAGYAIAKRATVAAAPLAAGLSCGLLAEALDNFVFESQNHPIGPSFLSEFQPLELAVADAIAGLDAAMALAWAAATAVDAGDPAAERLAREAKWVAAEAALASVDQLAAMLGVQGVIKGVRLEQLARDARAAQLVLGPNHVHRIEVARKALHHAPT